MEIWNDSAEIFINHCKEIQVLGGGVLHWDCYVGMLLLIILTLLSSTICQLFFDFLKIFPRSAHWNKEESSSAKGGAQIKTE